MGEALLVGVDVGTTNIKAVAMTPAGEVVAVASRPTPTHYPRPGWANYLISELWERFVAVLRDVTDALPAPGRIVSVAVTTFAETGMALTADGTPATDESIAWFDKRTLPQVEWLAANIGRDALFARSGLSLQPIFTLPKLLWVRENQPDVWARTARWLNSAEYFAFRLCGEQVTDFSLASRTLALDLHAMRWDEELLAEVGIPPSIFAPLAPGGTRLATIRPEVAAETGLPAHTVVGTGGHDHVCGAVAAGVIQPGAMLNSNGTAEAVFLPLTAPLRDPAVGRQGYTPGAHVIGGAWYMFAGQYTSGASIEWVRGILGEQGAPVPYQALIAEAAAVPAGSLGVTFLPHLRMANPPHDDPRSRGAFVGLSTDVTRGMLARAVFEGLCFETRQSYEPMLREHGVPPVERVIAIGGSTHNALLMQIKANVLNTPITVLDLPEATACGAALLGGISAGVFADVDAALAAQRHRRREIVPEPEAAALYERQFREVFQQLYPRLAPVSHAIDRTRQGAA